MATIAQLCAAALVIALAAGARIFIERGRGAGFRLMPAKRTGKRPLEAVDKLVLAPRHAIHLVRFADRMLVVAVHGDGCTLLESLPMGPEQQPTNMSCGVR